MEDKGVEEELVGWEGVMKGRGVEDNPGFSTLYITATDL
jgi:hypothetical protein